MSKLKIVAALCLIFFYILVILSYVLNFGWIRFFLAIIFLPYFISIIIVNFIYLASCPLTFLRIKGIKILFFSIISFLLANLFLPDGGDTGSSYCFFGLIKIKSDSASSITSTVFNIALYIFLIIHIYYYIKQIIEIKKFKKGSVVDK